jgi:hypothetical protein
MTPLWDTVPCGLVGVDRLIRCTHVIMREVIAHKLAKLLILTQSLDICRFRPGMSFLAAKASKNFQRMKCSNR